MTIDLFETTKTIWQTLARSLTKLLDKYGLRRKIIVYVKDEGALKSIVNCEYLGIEESF